MFSREISNTKVFEEPEDDILVSIFGSVYDRVCLSVCACSWCQVKTSYLLNVDFVRAAFKKTMLVFSRMTVHVWPHPAGFFLRVQGVEKLSQLIKEHVNLMFCTSATEKHALL